MYDAVYAFMVAVGEGYHEDFVRAFFRLKIQDIGSLLPHVLEIVRQASREHPRSLPDDIWQANEIVLASLTSMDPIASLIARSRRSSSQPLITET